MHTVSTIKTRLLQGVVGTSCPSFRNHESATIRAGFWTDFRRQELIELTGYAVDTKPTDQASDRFLCVILIDKLAKFSRGKMSKFSMGWNFRHNTGIN
ncbi:hypothetical protein U737_03015 [Methylomonas sp. LW13]|nr:hypothetical protein U737_03015 [Methylomonas sp. LW13]